MKQSIGVMTVATNIYIDYWSKMVASLELNTPDGVLINAHVFTDQPEKACKTAQTLKKVHVVVHVIPSYGWPEATLLRYEVFSQASNSLNEEILMHLDADMLIVGDFTTKVFDSVLRDEIVLVAHPGFWRPKKAESRHIDALRWLINKVKAKYGRKMGSWETNQNSTAYVPRAKREIYVCGGTWFGANSAVKTMMHELAYNVRLDIKNDVVAIWHDESHLNACASNHDYLLLDPSFCYVVEYAHLKELSALIVAVTKDEKTR